MSGGRKFSPLRCRHIYTLWCRVIYMMQNTKYGSSKTIHLAINDGVNTWPICGSKRHLQTWGSLPQQVSHDVTCKSCLKKSEGMVLA